MYTNLNPRTMGLTKYSYDELLAAASRNGFQGIELPAGAFGTMEKAREAGAQLSDLGMRCGLIMTPCDMYKVPNEAFDESLGLLARWAPRARAAGCRRAYNHIWSGHDERAYAENFEWHARRIRKVFEIFDGEGILYGLEFMGPKTVRDSFANPFVHSLGGIMALADYIDRKIGFVFDTIHWYCSGMRMDDLYLAARNASRIVNVHLNDADPRHTAETQIDGERGMPMRNGIIDAVAALKELLRGGYDGPVMVEPMRPTTDLYAGMPLDAAVADASSCLNGLFRSAGIPGAQGDPVRGE